MNFCNYSMFPTQFANPQGYFYPPPQHHGSQPAQHHGQTLGVIPIMYNLEGTNLNQVQDFQQQSNVVMMPPSGQQYRFQPPPQPQFVYVQSPSRLQVPSQELPFQHHTHLLVYNNRLFQSHPILQWKKIWSQQLLQLTQKVL